MKVRLLNGPFHGKEVEIQNRLAGILMEGPPLEDGVVAHYRPTRSKRTMRFGGLDRLLYRQPSPEGVDGG